MSADVIKEFLVSLGYKVDATGERKFVDGMKNVTAEATKLGLAAAAAATAVAAAVTKMASNLEDLYFMSQRTKASAENIQALGFAASQMGSSVEGARGSIEALSKFLRENPGGESLLGSIGVQTRDVNGALRDTTDIMQDLGKRLSGMPQYRAIAYANVFGIDYKTLMALQQGVDKFADRYKDMLHRFGLNVEKATEQSHNLMVNWRDMKASAGILSTIVGTTLIGVFDELQHRWQSLDQTTRDNIETGAKWVAGIVAGAALIATGPIGIIAALAAGIVALWDDYQVWKEGGKSLIDWGKWGPEVKLAKAGFDILSGALTYLSEDFRVMAKVAGDAYDAIKKIAGQIAGNPVISKLVGSKNFSIMEAINNSIPGVQLAKAYYYTHLKGGSASTGGPLGIRNNNPGNLRTGADGSFGHYATAQQGLSALGRQLSSYYNGTSAAAGHRKLQTLKDIISTYAPSNENNTGVYIGALAKQMGISPDAQLNLNDPAQLSSLMRGIVQHENGQNPYGAEMFSKAAGAAGAGGSGVKIDQSLNIQVHGSGNPHEVGSAVRDGVNGANGQLVRNLQGAVS